MVNLNGGNGPPAAPVKVFKSWPKALPQEGVIGIYGHRRKGKTALAWWIIEGLHQHRNQKIAVFNFPQKARHLLPKWVTVVDTIEALKKLRGYAVVADELALRAPARDFQKDSNKELFKMMAVAGQAHQLLLLLCQHSRQLDVGLVMEPDLILFKEPSQLHIRFARPELRPEIQEAWDRFAQVKGDHRKWTYVVDFHGGTKGFLKNELPTFWSEQLSEAYALYELEQLTSETKGPKRRARA